MQYSGLLQQVPHRRVAKMILTAKLWEIMASADYRL